MNLKPLNFERFKYFFLIFACFFYRLNTEIFSLSPTVDKQEENSRGLDRWQMTDFVWGLGMASQSDKGLEKNPKKFLQTYRKTFFKKENFKNLQSGDIIWMQCIAIEKFQKEILPSVKVPIVVVISQGDESFPSDISIDVESFLSNPNILHVFAQNCNYSGPSSKVSHLPIGMNFHSLAYKDGLNYKGDRLGEVASPKKQENELKNLLNTLKPTHLRKQRAFVDFHLSDTIRNLYLKRYLTTEDRTTIFNILLPANVMDYASDRMKRYDLWAIKGEYAFSISPHGNGLDCYRTWEDLILGCIVIVKTSALDPMYEGLPVVIVKEWSDITQENLKIWLDQYGDAFTNLSYREKLTNAYWLNKIWSIANPYREVAKSTKELGENK